jgi:TolA-binding protein
MSAPRRLIEADDELERELIRSAHGDGPSDRALERMLLGLGVEVSKLPPTLASASPSAAASSKIPGALLAKWLAAGMAIGAVTSSGAQLIGGTVDPQVPSLARTSESSLGRAAPPAPSQLSPPSQATPAPTLPASAVLPTTRPRPAPQLGLPAPAAAESSSSAETTAQQPALGSFALEPPPARPATLADEMRLLDAARRALADRDASTALSRLASYESAFPNGALQPEESVLKVRALLAAGNRAAAEALGKRVIERAPRSEHADAVRAVLGLATNP